MIDLAYAAASHPHLRRELKVIRRHDVVWFVLSLVVVLALSSYDGLKKILLRRKLRSDEGFDGMVAAARSKPQEKFAPADTPLVPFEGEFDIKFEEQNSLCWVLCTMVGLACQIVFHVCTCGCGRKDQEGEGDGDEKGVFPGTFKIIMTHDGDGVYKLEGGSATAAHGPASIVDGSADRFGKAWWLEERAGLKILTEGKFDYSNKTFEGRWWASDGKFGTYPEFAGKKEIETPAPAGSIVDEEVADGEATASSPQTLQKMLQADRPAEEDPSS